MLMFYVVIVVAVVRGLKTIGRSSTQLDLVSSVNSPARHQFVDDTGILSARPSRHSNTPNTMGIVSQKGVSMLFFIVFLSFGCFVSTGSRGISDHSFVYYGGGGGFVLIVLMEEKRDSSSPAKFSWFLQKGPWWPSWTCAIYNLLKYQEEDTIQGSKHQWFCGVLECWYTSCRQRDNSSCLSCNNGKKWSSGLFVLFCSFPPLCTPHFLVSLPQPLSLSLSPPPPPPSLSLSISFLCCFPCRTPVLRKQLL